MRYVFNDGGRAAAGYKGRAGDCATRAVAIAAELPYRQVYDRINQLAQYEPASKRRRGRSDARKGVYRVTLHNYMVAHLGWRWVPCMTVGSGCMVHMRANELPPGRLLVRLSRHYAAVIDGVLHDNHDCSRGGTRCVYGYYILD